jgi:hypothetical protein
MSKEQPKKQPKYSDAQLKTYEAQASPLGSIMALLLFSLDLALKGSKASAGTGQLLQTVRAYTLAYRLKLTERVLERIEGLTKTNQ